MRKIHIGCGPYPPSRKRYQQRFRCVEVSDTYFGPSRPATLKGWRDEADEGFSFILGAYGFCSFDPLDHKGEFPSDHPVRDFGLLQPTEANRLVWADTHEQALALGAKLVLLKTPPAFSPSQRNRDNLAAFVRDIVGEAPYRLVWEGRGIWQDDEKAALAAEHGMLVVQDPWGESQFPPVPEGDAYYAVTAPWGRTFFSNDDYFEFTDFLAEHPGDVYVVFRGPERERFAQGLSKAIAQELGPDAIGLKEMP